MHARYRVLIAVFVALAFAAPGAHAAETRQVYKSKKIKKYKAPKIRRYKAPKINRKSNRIR